MPRRWFDISTPLGPRTVRFAGDPAFESRQTRSVERGDAYSVSRISLGTHAGTHVDPPLHFFPGRAGADHLSPETLIGPARVVRVPDSADEVARDHLRGVPTSARRILFRTGNSRRGAARAHPGDVGLSLDVTDELVRRKVRLVGIDSLTIENDPTERYPVHRRLLENGVVILEGLRLEAVPPGPYALYCLPLRLTDGDGGPARAFLARLR